MTGAFGQFCRCYARNRAAVAGLLILLPILVMAGLANMLFQTVPPFILAIVLVAILTLSAKTIVLAIAVVSWPGVARLVRAEFMALRGREFVQAGVVLG